MGILNAFSGKKAVTKKTAKKSDDAKAPAEATAAASVQDLKGDAYRVILSPRYTEKASREQAMGKYVFNVALSATKIDVARAVRDLYGVKAESVRVAKTMGKTVRSGRYAGKRKDVKKAIVTLKKGDSINLAA